MLVTNQAVQLTVQSQDRLPLGLCWMLRKNRFYEAGFELFENFIRCVPGILEPQKVIVPAAGVWFVKLSSPLGAFSIGNRLFNDVEDLKVNGKRLGSLRREFPYCLLLQIANHRRTRLLSDPIQDLNKVLQQFVARIFDVFDPGF